MANLATSMGMVRRGYPERVTPPLYPAHREVRRVGYAGTFRRHAEQRFLSHAQRDQHIGLDEVADWIWNIVYHSTLLRKIDERPHCSGV